MDEYYILRNRQRSLMYRLKSFEKYLKMVQKPSINEVQLRLDKVKELWERFDWVQNEIEIHATGMDQFFLREDFEEIYFKVVCKANAILRCAKENVGKKKRKRAINFREKLQSALEKLSCQVADMNICIQKQRESLEEMKNWVEQLEVKLNNFVKEHNYY